MRTSAANDFRAHVVFARRQGMEALAQARNGRSIPAPARPDYPRIGSRPPLHGTSVRSTLDQRRAVARASTREVRCKYICGRIEMPKSLNATDTLV